MKITYLSLLLAGFLIQTGDISAQEKTKLYKWIDKDGIVHYSDEPVNGAKQVEIEEVPTIQIKMPKLKELETAGDDVKSPKEGDFYTSVSIIEPQNNGVIRNNGATVTISAQAQPALHKDHTVEIYLDGRIISKSPKSMSATANDVVYGPHTTMVIIKNKAGKSIRASQKHSFNLMHVLNKKRPKKS